MAFQADKEANAIALDCRSNYLALWWLQRHAWFEAAASWSAMSAESSDIIVVRHHDPADHATIGHLLDAYNLSRVHQEERPPLAVLMKDSSGVTIGGLWGHFAYDWLFIAMLIVPEHLRAAGTGRRIMETAEQVAISEGCLGIWLDTFDFQAAGFYKKLGFSQFGAIEDHPRGQSRLFFKKRLKTS